MGVKLEKLTIMFVAGNNNDNKLGIQSDAVNDGKQTHYKYVSQLKPVPDVNVFDIRCVAPGWNHTVIVMRNGDIYAAGKHDVIKGIESDEAYISFTKFIICSEEILWATAGEEYTLYLATSGRTILCYKKLVGEKMEIQLPKRAISVFGGRFSCGIIDEDGCAYFIDCKDPYKPIQRHEFPAPAIELVCCERFKIVLLSNFTVYGNGKLNNKNESFTLIDSLASYKIINISGYSVSCLALSENGLVFAFGENYYGQIGNGTTTNVSKFDQLMIPRDELIKDISCSGHTLLLSRDGELFGCGRNNWYQLFPRREEEIITKIERIYVQQRFTRIFARSGCSIAISGANLPDNPARIVFSNPNRLYELPSSFFLPIVASQYHTIKKLEDKVSELNDQINNYHRQMNNLVSLISNMALNIINQ